MDIFYRIPAAVAVLILALLLCHLAGLWIARRQGQPASASQWTRTATTTMLVAAAGVYLYAMMALFLDAYWAELGDWRGLARSRHLVPIASATTLMLLPTACALSVAMSLVQAIRRRQPIPAKPRLFRMVLLVLCLPVASFAAGGWVYDLYFMNDREELWRVHMELLEASNHGQLQAHAASLTDDCTESPQYRSPTELPGQRQREPWRWVRVDDSLGKRSRIVVCPGGSAIVYPNWHGFRDPGVAYHYVRGPAGQWQLRLKDYREDF